MPKLTPKQEAETAKPAGRPSTFTEEVAQEICIRIACGEALAAICRDEDMPAYRTVMTWLSINDTFQHNYARAREDQGNADADAVTDIGRRCLDGELDPQAARVAIDALKWSAGKRLPKKYGDRKSHELSGPNGGPIQTIDLSNVSTDDLERLEALFGPLASGPGDDDEGDQG